jgi:hypothetical protein
VDQHVADAVVLAVEERVGDRDGDLVPQLGRARGVREDEDVVAQKRLYGVRSYG